MSLGQNEAGEVVFELVKIVDFDYCIPILLQGVVLVAVFVRGDVQNEFALY